MNKNQIQDLRPEITHTEAKVILDARDIMNNAASIINMIRGGIKDASIPIRIRDIKDGLANLEKDYSGLSY